MDRDQGGKGKQPHTAGHGKAKGKGQGKQGGKDGKAGDGGKGKAGGANKGNKTGDKSKTDATQTQSLRFRWAFVLLSPRARRPRFLFENFFC